MLTLAGNATRDACTQASAAERMGADGLMVLPGLRYVGNRQKPFITIGRSAGRLACHHGAATIRWHTASTSPRDVQGAGRQAHARHHQSQQATSAASPTSSTPWNDRYALFCGVDSLAMEAQIMGAHGWWLAWFAPSARTVAIFELVRLGRIEEDACLSGSRPCSPWISRPAAWSEHPSWPQAMLDVGTEHVQAPRLPLRGAEREEVVKIVQDALSRRPRLPLDLSR